MKDVKKIKLEIIEAGYKAVQHLIEIAKEEIIKQDSDDDIAADKLKNAAMAKKLAIFDAFEILNRIEAEKDSINNITDNNSNAHEQQGFAERMSVQGFR